MKGFLFDLDGTLVDTAIDMLQALKLLAAEDGKSINPKYEQYKELITYGSKAIVGSIYGQVKPQDFKILQKRYLTIYEKILTQGSCLFTGIAEVIKQLDNAKIPWGIVTNKPYYLAKPLVDSLTELSNCGVLIGGDSCQYSKPHPQPLQKAIEQLKINPHKSWYIGDAQSDIQAGKAAKMQTAVALWGYLSASDEVHSWQANMHLNQPQQIITQISPRACGDSV